MFEFFQKRIAMQYPLIEDDDDSNPFTQTRDAHEAFLKSRSESVIGRDSVLQQASVINIVTNLLSIIQIYLVRYSING